MAVSPRFDDRLSTILAFTPHDESARAAIWAQLADVIADAGDSLSPQQRSQAIERLHAWRDDVPAARRAKVAAAIAGPILDRDIVLLFGRDQPAVAAPVLAQAQFDASGWRALIAKLPRASRVLLRERRDLPPEAKRSIEAFGAADLALPDDQSEATSAAPRVTVMAPATPPDQIRSLVDRIEAFQRSRAAIRDSSTAAAVRRFRFETDSEGTINWVEGVNRAAVIGISFAEPAPPGGFGVDGAIAGAFRNRAPIPQARLRIDGDSTASGDWLITAKPGFDTESGRFTGYRGTANRAEAISDQAIRGLPGDGPVLSASSDAMRQLVHELRTPLNAIAGFAELISGQHFGPVAHPYRMRAQQIVADASQLTDIFDDLETASRMSRGDLGDVGASDTDVATSLVFAAQSLEALSNERDVHVQIALGNRAMRVGIDRKPLDRMLARLIGMAIYSAEREDRLHVVLSEAGTTALIEVDRPKQLQAIEDHHLADASLDNDDDNLPGVQRPPLGFGFTFRLIDALARNCGGNFIIAPTKFTLQLPVIHDSATATQESV